MATTWEGSSALAAQSADRARTCSSDGISPVRRSQNRPSGRGSWPPGALGRSSWHSGMVYPRNLIPSAGSRTEVSVTRPFILIPPVQHVDGNLPDLGVAVLLAEGLHLLLEGRDLLGQDSLEVCRGGGIACLGRGSNQFLLPSKQSGTRLSEEGHGVPVQEVYADKRELALFS